MITRTFLHENFFAQKGLQIKSFSGTIDWLGILPTDSFHFFDRYPFSHEWGSTRPRTGSVTRTAQSFNPELVGTHQDFFFGKSEAEKRAA